MAIAFAWRPAQMASSTNPSLNGGGINMASTISTDVAENVLPNITNNEARLGVTTRRKIFLHPYDNASAELKAIQGVKVTPKNYTTGVDLILLSTGTPTDTEATFAPSNYYGVGKPTGDISSGATVISVNVEDYATYNTLQVFKVGDKIRIADLTLEEFTTLSTVAYLGPTIQLTIGTPTVRAYVAANTYVANYMDVGSITPSVAKTGGTSASGVFNVGNVQITNVGCTDQVWTLTFTSSNAYTVTCNSLGVTYSGSIGANCVCSTYLAIPPSCFSGTWAVADTVVITTTSGTVPIWVTRINPAGMAVIPTIQMSIIGYGDLPLVLIDNWAFATKGSVTGFWANVAASQDLKYLAISTSSGKVLYSSDYGVSWSYPNATSRSWTGLAISNDGTKLIGVISSGLVYTSTDSGVTWTGRGTSKAWRGVAASTDGVKAYAVTNLGYVFRSTDSGVTWTQGTDNLDFRSISCSPDGTKVVATGYNYGVIFSLNSGVTFSYLDTTNFPSPSNWVSASITNNGTIIAVSSATGSNGGAIAISKDSGMTVTCVTPYGCNPLYAATCSSDGTKMMVVSDLSSILYSSDSGTTWRPVSVDNYTYGKLLMDSTGTKAIILRTDASSLPYFGTSTGVTSGVFTAPYVNYRLFNKSSSYYSNISGSSDLSKICTNRYSSLMLSTDMGGTWTEFTNTSTTNYRNAISPNGSNYVAISSSSAIKVKIGANGFVTRTASDTGDLVKLAILDNSNIVYALYYGIQTSINAGVSWVTRLTTTGSFTDVAVSPGMLVVAESNKALRKSTDFGVTWADCSAVRDWWSVAFSADGTKLVAVIGAIGQLYVSTDLGGTWVAKGPTTQRFLVAAISNDGTRILAYSDTSYSMYYSTNGGTTFNTIGARFYLGASADATRSMVTNADLSMAIVTAQWWTTFGTSLLRITL